MAEREVTYRRVSGALDEVEAEAEADADAEGTEAGVTANSDDADEIAEVLRVSRVTAMPWLPVVHTPEEDRAWVRAVLLPEHTVWVAEQDARIVGVLAIRPGWLDQLYVLPDAQGAGIGTRMLRIARDANPGELRLWAFQGNERARRFYERAGFVVERMTDGADNEERAPDVLYRWTP
ncbi:GNAT family N-acetyltransferase [Planctomonas psychrotolerans]|uniref:GNAT family N-acetyltransferase n=1 Tax=Planctomonas psychrotolerans TaxID=2528712 RepID=UPI00123A0D68|nr:GNAT family N-acetyltransferase [Planctomonas psychrotolerans]